MHTHPSRLSVAMAIMAALAFGFSLTACGNKKALNSNEDERTGQAFVFLTDYQSGALAEYDATDTSITNVPLPSLHTDVALRSYGGLLYVIERFGKDAVRVIAPKTPSAPLANYSVGNGTNPQDIVVVDDKTAYVFRLNATNILKINPMTGDSIGTIDASPYADAADGKPELAGAVRNDGTIYAIAQVLDTKSDPFFWPPTGPGKLLLIAVQSDAITGAKTLTIENPVALAKNDDVIYIAGGPYGDLSKSGIDEYRSSTGAVRNVIGGAALGGRPTALEPLSDGTAWVLVAKDWPNATVYRVDMTSGTVADSLIGPTSPSAIALGDADQLIVSDRSMTNPGVYVFDALTGKKIKGPISTALPPDAVAFLRK